MHQFLSDYYFTLMLLRVSASVYHPQRARQYLLNADLRLWLVRCYAIRGCVCSVWRPGACRSISATSPHNIQTTTHYTEFYQPKPKLACNSASIDEFPEDGTQLPKHVGAVK
jgi:hypothetical protein